MGRCRGSLDALTLFSISRLAHSKIVPVSPPRRTSPAAMRVRGRRSRIRSWRRRRRGRICIRSRKRVRDSCLRRCGSSWDALARISIPWLAHSEVVPVSRSLRARPAAVRIGRRRIIIRGWRSGGRGSGRGSGRGGGRCSGRRSRRSSGRGRRRAPAVRGALHALALVPVGRLAESEIVPVGRSGRTRPAAVTVGRRRRRDL